MLRQKFQIPLLADSVYLQSVKVREAEMRRVIDLSKGARNSSEYTPPGVMICVLQ